eukprot:51422_1
MGTEFTKLKENQTHNVDIAYDYRFFFDYLDDNIHKDCLQYIQPYKVDPNENDKQVLVKYFDQVSNQDLNKHSKQMDINPSLRCYCLDGLLVRYLKHSDAHAIEALLMDSIKCMLMDDSIVSLSESLFGMNAVWMLPFHHVLQYLSSNLNHQIETYIFDEYNVFQTNSKDNEQSFVDKMNEMSNLEAQQVQHQPETQKQSQAKSIVSNYEMIFALLRNNALRNQCTQNYDLLNKMMMFHDDQNDEELSLKYIPIIAMYRHKNDVLFIESWLNKGPAHKAWFAAMDAVQYYPDPQFWEYLMLFFKKIYTHISLVNGETVPKDLEQSVYLQQKQNQKKICNAHAHACHDYGEDEKDDVKSDNNDGQMDAKLLNEGQPEEDSDENENDDMNKHEDDDNLDYKSLIDESQYYDIATQMRFIKTLCVFSVSDPSVYSEKVCASIHHLLDIPKANTNNGYYEESMSYLLKCIPFHWSMRSVIFRIWQVYGVCDWRYLNELIDEASYTQIAFKQFLMGTNKRIGHQSNILKIAGEQGILKNIHSFLKDPIYKQSLQLLVNYDNIIWWSPIAEESKYIMETLKCVNNLFDALVRINHKSRFVLYEKFKEKHNTRITEKFVFPKFDSLLL